MSNQEIPRPKQIVIVEWDDAQTVDRGGWCDISDVMNKKHGAPSYSVGYLLGKDEKLVRVAGSLSMDQEDEMVESVSGTMLIPIEMVKKITVIKRFK